MKASKFKIVFIVTLCLLTFTVIVYDIHVLNPPKVLYIRNFAHGIYKEEYSWETMVNVTDHPLKEEIMSYINKSIRLGKEMLGMLWGERIYVFSPEVSAFFGKYYVSTWCGTCQMAMSPRFIDGNSFYSVLIGYTKVHSSLLECSVAWVVSIATVILWIYANLIFGWMKAEKSENENV